MFRVSPLLPALALLALVSCKKEGSEGGGLFAPKAKVLRVGITNGLGAAPIFIAEKQGLFGDANIEVTMSTHKTTEEIRSQLASGQLDVGMITPAEALLSGGAVVVPHILTRNEGQISVSEQVWNQMETHLLLDTKGAPLRPVSADALVPVAQAVGTGNPPLTFSVASLHDTSTYTLCYWLGTVGITPIVDGSPIAPGHPYLGGASVAISTAPATTAANQGYAGASQGERVIGNSAILRDVPTSVLAFSESWASANHDALVKVVAGLIEAGNWLDASIENRRQASTDLAASVPNFEKEATPMVSFGTNASAAPDHNHALWIGSQMIRWGQLTDTDLQALVTKVYRSDLFREAAATLSAPLQGLDMRLQEQSLAHFIDGNAFAPQRASAYARSFEIGSK